MAPAYPPAPGADMGGYPQQAPGYGSAAAAGYAVNAGKSHEISLFSILPPFVYPVFQYPFALTTYALMSFPRCYFLYFYLWYFPPPSIFPAAACLSRSTDCQSVRLPQLCLAPYHGHAAVQRHTLARGRLSESGNQFGLRQGCRAGATTTRARTR